MAESVLLAVVRGVAGKAADKLVQKVTRMCGLDGDRETLKLHLLAVERKLASAEERSGSDHAVKMWMKKLKDVTREADDVLDDFQYEALRREAQIDESTSRKVMSYVTHNSPLRFRYVMSGKLKNVLEKISKLVEDMNKFGLENSIQLERPQQPPMRQTHSKLDEFTEIFGRDNEKRGVVKLLLDQQDQQKVQVLPIFGMGGLGKTTIAKMVYNDQEIQQHFQLKIWHSVSANFDVITILKSIIQLVTNGSDSPPDSIQLLVEKLEQVIGQNRFLLVLDDVWNEERALWEDNLKPLLCSVGGRGSVILVTCRSKQVADIMYTIGPHMLNYLSEEDSWKLFSMKAFSHGVEEQAEFVNIGRRIADKCGRLPLALKTMGGLLSSKQQIEDWKAIEEISIGDNVGGSNGVMSILKLSYKHLSSEMKQCFAICALFSKDYEMEKDMLIQLWMANGFIIEEKTMDLTQKGEVIFHNLVQRSFLQDVKVAHHHFYDFYYHITEYETIVCTMHDLMHDLAIDVSGECATIEELIEKKASIEDVCYLQMSSKIKLENISGLFKSRNSYLRTLLAPSRMRQDFNGLPYVSLRALHWQIEFHSPISFKAINSKHLRYLDLSSCGVNDSLLDSICKLYNLQTLKLNGCSELRQFPENMVISLTKLIHLYVRGCRSLENMPRHIGQLNNLRTLTRFVVGTVSGCGIEELRDLQHLSNRLELYSLRKIRSANHAKEANLQEKQYLSELLFSWGLTEDDEPENEECNEQEVFQHLKPHSNIQILELYGYGGLDMPQWIGDPQMFKCLRKLTISNCTRCKNIPLLWLSSSLEYLSIDNSGNMRTLCGNNLGIEGGSVPIFPKLKRIRVEKLASLERWVDNSVGEAVDSFPVLEHVWIAYCPMLAVFPLSPALTFMNVTRSCTIATSSNVEGNASSSTLPLSQLDIPRLPASLEILWIQFCKSWVALPSNLGDLGKLRELGVNSCSGLKALADGMDGLTSLRELAILSCPAIEEFPNGLLQRLPALERLSILSCPELQRRCSEGGEYFDLVSSIPRKLIPHVEPEAPKAESIVIEAPEAESMRTDAAQAESRGNKFLRRLVPCCAHPKSNSESDCN